MSECQPGCNGTDMLGHLSFCWREQLADCQTERDAALERAESVPELLAAIEHYDDVRANAKDPGRVGSIIKLARETDITPREHWRPEAIRLFRAILVAAPPATAADHPFVDACSAGCSAGTHSMCGQFNCVMTREQHPEPAADSRAANAAEGA